MNLFESERFIQLENVVEELRFKQRMIEKVIDDYHEVDWETVAEAVQDEQRKLTEQTRGERR